MFTLAVISSEKDTQKEAEKVNRMFDNGLQLFHLRKPGSSIRTLQKLLDRLDEDYLNRVIIHTHYQLLQKYPLKGIHLRGMQEKKVTKGVISTSFHSLEELNHPDPFEYVFLSPVFNSISKQDYPSTFQLKEVALHLKNTKQKVMALGGCQGKHIPELKKIGFYGMGVLGAIWQSPDPVQSFIDIEQKIRRSEDVC